MDSATVEILHQDIDPEGRDASYYRMLVNGKHIKYVTIEPGIYEHDDLCFPPILLEKLPTLPDGDWNCGWITQSEKTSAPNFSRTLKATLPSIDTLWHSESYDYLSLHFTQRLKSNVYVVSSEDLKTPVIAKFARFDWEVNYYVAETQAYSWIDGHNIGPVFLGHLKEHDRTIGLLVEKVQGRYANHSDLSACEAIVKRLHNLGIVHGDLNKYNFIISNQRVVLIDFETAKRSNDRTAMEEELKQLPGKLLDTSGIGSVVQES